ncbi:stalk domain-containing protein [Paenibacillus sp. sgz302251]|uniref:stalk domain-containing protein n=1 Tax=Paenibacillus sp. sgz302251 TaxID=3414493 RepID=UPI003C7BB6A6
MIKGKIGKKLMKQFIAAGLLISLAGTGIGGQEIAHAAERKPIKIDIVHGQKHIKINGTTRTMSSPLPIVKGVTMIPIHTIAGVLGAKVYNDSKGTHIDTYLNKVTINANMRGANRNGSYVLMASPVLRINGATYVPLSSVKQLWNGSYTFDPQLKLIQLTIIPDPNVSPVAGFTAPTEVKLGEPIMYEDLSYDPDGKIVKTDWTGRKNTYFEPGVYTVTQTVYDNEGAFSETKSQDINVIDEVMYTPFEYYMRYGNPGDRFKVDAALMNTYPYVQTSESKGLRTLYMSNAPERVFGEGLLYRDDLIGPNRLFIHHRNGSEERLKLAVVVTNEQDESIKLTIGNRGLAGPSANALQFGGAAVTRFLTPSVPRELIIEPGQSISLLPEMEKMIMNPNEGFGGVADIDSDGLLTFTTMALKEFTDPVSVAFSLPELEKVGNRGTFPDADLYIDVTEKVGLTEQKLRLGSRGNSVVGMDALKKVMAMNGGEYGVVTTIRLKDVAYGTRIILNPRAGNYQGAVTVNGKVFSMPTGGHVNYTEGVLLYHQQKPEGAAAGAKPKEVTITYTSPGASSLPILLVFLPGSSFE